MAVARPNSFGSHIYCSRRPTLVLPYTFSSSVHLLFRCLSVFARLPAVTSAVRAPLAKALAHVDSLNQREWIQTSRVANGICGTWKSSRGLEVGSRAHRRGGGGEGREQHGRRGLKRFCGVCREALLHPECQKYLDITLRYSIEHRLMRLSQRCRLSPNSARLGWGGQPRGVAQGLGLGS